MDLKPALDGYAGIPQESRLLFRGLRSIESLSVHGLIQHGGRQLRPGLSDASASLSRDQQINQLSRFVVSVYEKPQSSLLDLIGDYFNKKFALQWMRIRSSLGMGLKLSAFEPAFFEDFVWRTFFSKTLGAGDKSLIENSEFRILPPSRHSMQQCGLAGLKLSQNPSFPLVDTSEFDYFITQTPFPGRVHPQTRMVVRYHDAVPILLPHTISNKSIHQAAHFYPLKSNIRQGAIISCISEATRSDLLNIFPEAEGQTRVIHNVVSDEYFPEEVSPKTIAQIIQNRLVSLDGFTHLKTEQTSGRPAKNYDFLLMVSTIEPRKNHQLLLQAWELLKYSIAPNLKIIFVGNTGWDQGPVVQAFQPWAKKGELFWLANVPSPELRALYNAAAVTVCPGLAEGFDYSGVEAMKCGGLVAASDISVHREIYRDGAAYFNPYDAEGAARALFELLRCRGTEAEDQRRQMGIGVADRYRSGVVMSQWREFFDQPMPTLCT